MSKKILTSALFAGLAAGALAALLQFTFVVPVMMEGELYEFGDRVHFTDLGPMSPAGRPDVWSELPRHFSTFASNLVTYTGLAFIMVALFAIVSKRGVNITARAGLVWGLCGFFAMNLAPAFGLPPELPGTASADLDIRQYWWIATVAATAAGLGLFAFGKMNAHYALAVILIALPHLIGAPHLDTYYGYAPPEVGSLFVARSLGVAAIAWLSLGYFAGALWERD